MTDKRKKKKASGLHIALSVLAAVLTVLIIISLGILTYRFAYAVFDERNSTDGQSVEAQVTITKDMSGYEIGQVLESAGLIRDPLVFAVQEGLSAYHGREQTGTYTLDSSETTTRMLAVLSGDDD